MRVGEEFGKLVDRDRGESDHDGWITIVVVGGEVFFRLANQHRLLVVFVSDPHNVDVEAFDSCPFGVHFFWAWPSETGALDAEPIAGLVHVSVRQGQSEAPDVSE